MSAAAHSTTPRPLHHPRACARLLGGLLMLVAVAFAPGLTWAQAPEGAQVGSRSSTSGDDARARELYVIGDEFYANGRYEAAEEAFAEAYRLSGRPLLLFNLANAQERSGRWSEAVANLRRYRERAPSAEHAALDARLSALERRIAERDADARDEPVVVMQHESVELPATRASSQAAPREAIPPQRVLLPAAGALALTTFVLALRVRSVRDDVRAQCVTTSGQRFCLPSAADALARDRRLSVATDLLALGTLATVALGAWQLYAWRHRPDDATRTLQVGVARGAFQLSLRGGF